ncbi:MAG: transferase [Cyanobacteria bacterium P01_A01_bin.84]
MSVPPLRLYNQFEPYISGEVNIHPSAVIAPGVILQAAPTGKIVIGPGVCIGMGSILKVNEGTLTVEEGANIGSGFLMIGAGKIGANACIGSATTVFKSSIESGIVIAPGSVLGDNSRKITLEEESNISTSVHSEEVSQSQSSLDTEMINGKVESESIQENLISQSSIFTSTKQYFRNKSGQNKSSKLGETVGEDPHTNRVFSKEQNQSSELDEPVADGPSTGRVISKEDEDNATNVGEVDTQQSQLNKQEEKSTVDIGTHIYGRGNIERLLVTLFPHRQALNNKSLNEESD